MVQLIPLPPYPPSECPELRKGWEAQRCKRERWLLIQDVVMLVCGIGAIGLIVFVTIVVASRW